MLWIEKALSGDQMKPQNLKNYALVGLGLAVIVAIGYVLIALGALSVGDLSSSEDGGNIVYVAAACYLVGGLLILTRKNWLLIIGVIINTMVMVMFFSMYSARPAVMFSPGGLTTKIAQLLLEAALLVLIMRQAKENQQKRLFSHN